jgi:hypothetical protein
MSESGARFRERFRQNPVGLQKYGQLVTKLNGVQTSSVKVQGTLSVTPVDLERTWDFNNPGPPYYTGGTFRNIKAVIPQSAIQGNRRRVSKPGYSATSGGVTYEYGGGFANPIFVGDGVPDSFYGSAGYAPIFSGFAFPTDKTSLYGPKVYKQLRPKIEKAGIGVAIAEIRDLPGMLSQTAKRFHEGFKILGGQDVGGLRAVLGPKAVADDFLNHSFGWVPFLKDLEDLIRVFLNQQEYIARLSRDNNRWQKRQWTFLQESAPDTIINYGYSAVSEPRGAWLDSMRNLGPAYGGGNSYSTWQLRRRQFDHVWAEGSFKYYRPEFDMTNSAYHGQMATIYRYLTIYGIRVNPSTLYKATPWSWLVDWFTNLGELIERVTDWGSDSLVARYMFLMQHSVRTVNLAETHYFWDGAETFEWNRIIETKQRDKAESPYGFNLKWESLSPFQLAILAALPISKRKFQQGR